MEDNTKLKRDSSTVIWKDFQDILSSEEKWVEEHVLNVKICK